MQVIATVTQLSHYEGTQPMQIKANHAATASKMTSYRVFFLTGPSPKIDDLRQRRFTVPWFSIL